MKQLLKKKIQSFISKGQLPCYILWHKPLIIINYEKDFIEEHEKIFSLIQDKAYVFLMNGYHRETVERVMDLKKELKRIRK